MIPALVTDPFTIVLTPAGHLLLRPAEPHEPRPSRRRRAGSARRSSAATRPASSTSAPPRHGPRCLRCSPSGATSGAPSWRRSARCRISRSGASAPIPRPAPGELERLAAAAPPMPGGEYLTADVLRALWAGRPRSLARRDRGCGRHRPGVARGAGTRPGASSAGCTSTSPRTGAIPSARSPSSPRTPPASPRAASRSTGRSATPSARPPRPPTAGASSRSSSPCTAPRSGARS